MDSEPMGDLAAHAHEKHVVVIGAGIAGLVAALECAKVGIAVTLVDAADRPGGTIGEARLGGMPVGTGATCWATAGGGVRRLVDELGLGDRVVAPAETEVWVSGLAKGAARMPRDTVRGIPANPWADEVRAFIGWSGAWRAYVDRLRPPMTIGVERSLARLVGSRMGEAVLERMVAPLTVGGYGIRPEEVDVEVAAPGLSTALTRTGSLGGAVSEQLAERTGPGIESLSGGMPQLVDALSARLSELGVVLLLGAEATGLAPEADGRWAVEVRPVTDEDETPAPLAPIPAADAVIVATDEPTARALLEPAVRDLAAVRTRGPIAVETVTLVVDAPALDAHPRGTVCHPVPGTSDATAVMHETARWAWLAEVAGAGRHVLRVSFGDAAASPAIAGMSDAEAVEAAAVAASAMLGVPRADLAVRDGLRRRHLLARPASVLGHADDTAAVRAAIGAVGGLAAVGAWLGGSGLAHTAADAATEADRVRRVVLWGIDTPG